MLINVVSRNRLIATHFLTLPSKVRYEVLSPINRRDIANVGCVPQKEIPQYYLEVGLPMALDTIEVSHFHVPGITFLRDTPAWARVY